MEKEFADVMAPRAVKNDDSEIVPFTVFYQAAILSCLNEVRGQNENHNQDDSEG